MDVMAAQDGPTGGMPAPGSATAVAPGVPEPLLRLRGISKHFGAVQALYGVDLDLPNGQVTALCGDNGAGKSVLTKCIAGIHAVGRGRDLLGGTPGPHRQSEGFGGARDRDGLPGPGLADNLDIVQNMFLGRERLSRTLLDEDSMERSAAETLASLHVTTVRSIRQPVATLSGGQRQAVAVAKAVMWNSKLVMLDEPTAALGVAQTRMVLDLILRLKEHGLAVMVISHNLNDVFEVADRVAVLRLGRMVAQDAISAFDRQSVVDFMTTGASSREVPGSGSSHERN